ncbi:hypothetical protein EI427_17045 [Flammeovirga pectinis]|uniref:Uncharacterized protein n=1 Tax=Flammeovirga pectinis TaxID=2494373 RepID=A0A3S9P6N3_9BACT|nr:hypothetical protein [Flammeovirga pectinis]AZQ63870.1 hypothetical protein EI427_17045 [Flammeovirga pectinis]
MSKLQQYLQGNPKRIGIYLVSSIAIAAASYFLLEGFLRGFLMGLSTVSIFFALYLFIIRDES